MSNSQQIANTAYTSARIQSKEGKQLLEKGLVEMRAKNHPLARTLLNCALEHFGRASRAYEKAHESTPSEQLKAKYEKKARMLRISDVRCTHKALRRMMPKAEPPMDMDAVYKALGTSGLV